MSAIWLETDSLLSSYSGKMQSVALQLKVKCGEEQQENRNTLEKSLGLRIRWPCARTFCNGFVGGILGKKLPITLYVAG